MEASDAEKPTFRIVEVGGKPCVILSCLDVLDEKPALLVQTVPFFTEEEWAVMATLTKEENRRRWERRVRVVEEQIRARAANPKHNVYWPWADSTCTALVDVAPKYEGVL